MMYLASGSLAFVPNVMPISGGARALVTMQQVR